LEKTVVQRRLDLMSRKASVFDGINVGADYHAEQLTEEFDAIVLCAGATRPRDLPLPGRSLQASISRWISTGQHQELAGSNHQMTPVAKAAE